VSVDSLPWYVTACVRQVLYLPTQLREQYGTIEFIEKEILEVLTHTYGDPTFKVLSFISTGESGCGSHVRAVTRVRISRVVCPYLHQVRDADTGLDGTRLLFDTYRPLVWYWELIVTTRRLILTGAIVALQRGSVLQFTAGLTVCLVGALLQISFQPYCATAENALALMVEVRGFKIPVLLIPKHGFGGKGGGLVKAIILFCFTSALTVLLVQLTSTPANTSSRR